MIKMDNRGQATGIANFFLSLLVAAVMTWIITEVTSPIVDKMRASTAEGDVVGQQMNEWIVLILDNQPILFLLIAMFSMIALAVFSRAVLR